MLSFIFRKKQKALRPVEQIKREIDVVFKLLDHMLEQKCDHEIHGDKTVLSLMGGRPGRIWFFVLTLPRNGQDAHIQYRSQLPLLRDWVYADVLRDVRDDKDIYRSYYDLEIPSGLASISVSIVLRVQQ